MKPYLFFLLVAWGILFSSAELQAQDEQQSLSETISWLERKINISYYNAQTQEWWSNRFFYNTEMGLVNIKNTSSDGPSFLTRNTYYDRKVLLSDLDASSIKVHDINEDQGRIVFGQVVQVNVIGNQKKIKRTKNGVASFNEFFLQIPVPHAYDSLRLTADSIKTKLTLAIELSSKIKPTNDEQQNAKTILSTLHGQFKGDDKTVMSFTKIEGNHSEVEHTNEQNYIRKGLIGFDEVNNHFYLWSINRGQRERLTLEVKSGDKVSIESIDPPYAIILYGVNHIAVRENGQEIEFYRMGD
ncbi:hypothetical protein N6H18_14360 [Reichenbachiella agarivorans]|uniref:Uncharacterized protein n=1 Tax=Reichenbachiella agarivorans TaxID=2979464 RepID=A0ABY6CM03_9BACT|nr:hypothetical protein [Reichenbachiella agarivorans]UXP31531.1 hypothetical protein N6H18_14360 [Reichenbachiella agarivorans]